MSETLFDVEVDGVTVSCKAQKNFKITLFVDRPKAERRLVAMQNGETREEAAVRSIRQRTASELAHTFMVECGEALPDHLGLIILLNPLKPLGPS